MFPLNKRLIKNQIKQSKLNYEVENNQNFHSLAPYHITLILKIQFPYEFSFHI